MDGGRMAGRRDVDADCSDLTAFAAVRGRMGAVDKVITSPAKRCLQTTVALLPQASSTSDARLWEQDFGLWEGLPYVDLPDLGPLTTAQIAAHRPPEGESFDDLCARALPALGAHQGRVCIIAHAGVIRAALGWALGRQDAGLTFQIAPLSLTKIIVLADGQSAISCVNWTAR
jgi:alpha-ribazole phosphatase